MPVSILSQDRASNIGVGRIVYWNEIHSGWQHFAMAKQVSLKKAVVQVDLEERLGNTSRAIQTANIKQMVRVKATIMEALNPDVMEIILGGSTLQQFNTPTAYIPASQMGNDITGSGDDPEIIHLPEYKSIPVIHHTKCRPQFEAGTTSIAPGGFGNLPTGNYHVRFVSHYDPSNDYGTLGTAAGPIPVVGPTGSIGLSIVPPTNEIPDHYSVWIDDGAGGDIKWLMNTALTVATITDLPDANSPVYSTPAGGPFVVENLDGSVTYYNGVDYTLDMNTMGIRRIAGSSIADGQPVRVYYYYLPTSNVKTGIGINKMTPRILKLRIFQLAGMDIDGVLTETGLAWELDRVDMTSDDVEWGLSEKNFFRGLKVELKCLVDTSTQLFGSIYGYDPVIENWQGLGF